MLNRVVLMGRMVANPELKTTASNVSVTSFRIAVDRNYVKQGEERKADFIDIVCWRQQAEFVCKYFSKGSLIAVEGQLQTRTYQAKDGTNRYVVEVIADNISFTGDKRDGNNNVSQTQNRPSNNNQNQAQQPPQTQAQQGYNQSYQQDYNHQPYQQASQPVPSYQSGYNSDFQEMPLDEDLPF